MKQRRAEQPERIYWYDYIPSLRPLHRPWSRPSMSASAVHSHVAPGFESTVRFRCILQVCSFVLGCSTHQDQRRARTGCNPQQT